MENINKEDTQANKSLVKRDWFGYILTAIVGLFITVGATWWQAYSIETQASAAEYERLYSVRNSIVSIVEERVLNNLEIDPVVINRMIEQRRREQRVSISLNINDVVDQAEFNIASSKYLSLDKKEEVKNTFKKFHIELSNQNFEDFKEDVFQYDLLNNISSNIKSGNSIEALTGLKRLSLNFNQQIEETNKKSTPIFIEVMHKVFSEKLGLFAIIYFVILMFTGSVYILIRSKRQKYLEGKINYDF